MDFSETWHRGRTWYVYVHEAIWVPVDNCKEYLEVLLMKYGGHCRGYTIASVLTVIVLSDT